VADNAGIVRKRQAMAAQCGTAAAGSLHQVKKLQSDATTAPSKVTLKLRRWHRLRCANMTC